MQSRLALDSQSVSLSLQSVGITSMYYHPALFFSKFFGVLGIKPRASHMVNKCSFTELYS
jgi:hypothetical protein